MADITLKAYLAHLDDLLSRRQYEEAEAHCKHILAKYPKNLSALKRLAKSQFEAGDFNAAESTYSSVLSMDPRSAEAYVGLSWVARQRGQGEQAIALLERAYEQDTNNTEAVQLLHDAHRTFNDRTNAKLPQTQFIAARQQFRSGLAQQAVSTLNGALAADSARADVRLLKMEILQQTGEGMEAARTATDVLKQLPDCVDANKMLAEFWKAQGRSSDAQRFVTRVEAAEPYLAFEIATGAPPSDDVLMLSLLNFRAAPSPATSTDAPDWMSALGMNEPTEMAMPKVDSESMAWLDNADAAIEEDSEKLDQSWLTDVQDMPEDLSWLTDAAVAATDSGDTGDDFDFDVEFGEVKADAPLPPSLNMNWMDDAPAADDGDTLDSISTKMAREEVKSAQVLDELAALSPEPAENADGLNFLNDKPSDGEQEWMNAIDIASSDPTTPDRQNFDDFLKNFTSFDEITPETVSQSSKTGLTSLLSGLTPSEGEGEAFAEPVSPDIIDIDPEDPLAWMRAGVSDEEMLFDDSDDMPDLEALTGDMEPVSETPAPHVPAIPELAALEEEDPFAWMQQHDVELIDSTPEPSLWDDPMGVEQGEQSLETNEDPLAWMQNSGIVLDESDDADADPLAWAKESGVNLLEDIGTANFKNTASLSAEMAEMGAAASETPSPIDEIATNQPPSARSGLLGYVKDDGAAQEGDSPMSDKDLPDWLNGPDDEEEAEKPAASGDLADFDWMAVASSDNDSDIDWDAVPDSVAADEGAPDWLASLENPVDDAEAAALSAKDDPNVKDLWDDTADDIATPDWMAALRDENSPEEPAGQAEDWMFSQGEAAKDEVDGASEDMLATAKDEIAADASADWLNDAAPAEAAAPVDAGSDVDGMMDWLNASTPAEAVPAPESPEETPAAAEAVPDWLNAVTSDEAAAIAALPEDEEIAADAPDWLSAVAPSDAELTAEDAVADLDWMSTLASDAPEEADSDFAEAVSEVSETVTDEADNSMDWLNAATDQQAVQSAAEAAPVSAMAWLEDDDTGDQTNAFVAHDSLDWLTGGVEDVSGAAADEADRAVSPEFMGAASGDFDFGAAEQDAAEPEQPSYELSFLDDDEPTSDVATVELEGDPLPDWLMESRGQNQASKLDIDVPEAQLYAQGELSGEILDDADLLEAEPPLQESLNASAVNSPDWLNAMVPGLDISGDTGDDEEQPAESDFFNGGRSDYAWLNAVVAEELAPPAMAAPNRRAARYPFSEPPAWLANLREETQVAAPVMDLDTDDDSLPDWLKFDDAEAN